MTSVEEKTEEYFKNYFRQQGIRYYGKTEMINSSITNALKNSNSKSGKSGNNYPDIKLFLTNTTNRNIPVMIEAKGSSGKLEKLTKTGEIEEVIYYNTDTASHKAGEPNYSSIQNYAVNGALHYGRAILDEGTYKEVIIIGINGSRLDEKGNLIDPEWKAYYVSKKNNNIPKTIQELNLSLSLLKNENLDHLFSILDQLNLTEAEIQELTRKTEQTLESKIKKIHQSLYDDEKMKNLLSTNEKLYLFCGLIMAGLKTEGMYPLSLDNLAGNDEEEENDGTVILNRIRSFLRKKKCSNDKVRMVTDLLKPVFQKPSLWKPTNGESMIKCLFKEVQSDIIPCLESNLHLDFTGKILNSLNDWVQIENDKYNDVVLTPRYITTFMAKLAHTNKDSFVWDRAMGSGGFLISAMDLMIKDAKDKLKDPDELEDKIRNIKENQLLGVEILGNIYILAVLNMILMGDGSSKIICGDSHTEGWEDFPATVFLLNPPYSAEGKGFIFVKEALDHMTNGYACVLIQENAGAGQGLPYTKQILENNTLIASIHMPSKLFIGKAGVQTAIYVFQVARPHEADDMVKFIDFSEDGYSRQNRRKSTQEVNLRDTDDASGRYAEVESIVLGKKPKTSYYTKENTLYLEDCISLEGNDWTYAQHKKVDLQAGKDDFAKTVREYLAWKVSCVLKGQVFA